MKELSIEEKAKAYDKAFKKAETLYKASEPMSGCNVIIETLFPELKESEDEKIRKSIIAILNNYVDDSNTFKSKMLDWVEKQCEKVNTIEGFETEFERQVSHLIASVINKEYEYNQGYVKWTANALLNYAKHELERQGEQKPADEVKPKWKPTDKDIFELQCVINNDPYNGFILKALLEQLKKLKGEQ